MFSVKSSSGVRLPYDKAEFEAAIACFEKAWHTGQRPSLAEHLPAEGPLRNALLAELVAIDLEFRRRHGETCDRSEYERQFPELLQEAGVKGQSAHATDKRTLDSTARRVSHEAPQAIVIPEFFGRYQIVKELGRGAMGAVYLARDIQLDRDVALKVPKFTGDDTPQHVARFYREARASAALRHPHICPVYDVGEIDGQSYITMAYIVGCSLREVARGTPRFPQRQVATLVRKLALGMAEAHLQGVIHRDLKPANIMIDANGEPVITDFGLARRFGAMQSISIEKGALVGTPAYMSPEQVDGDSNQIGPASDVYGLGVVFYELLTGRLPFEGDAIAVLKKIGVEEPPRPSVLRRDIEPQIEAICLKMIARRPEDRFGSMQEVADSLSEYLDSAGEIEVENGARIRLPQRDELRGDSKRSSRRFDFSTGLIATIAVAFATLLLIGLSAFIHPDERIASDPLPAPGSLASRLPEPRQAVEFSTSTRESLPFDVAGDSAQRVTDCALQLDTGNRVTINTLKLDRSGELTFELYVTAATIANGDFADLMGVRWQIDLYLQPATNQLTFSSRYVSETPGILGGPIVREHRTHIAAVRTSRELRLFVNGMLVGTQVIRDEPLVESAHPFFIGGREFAGSVDEIRISNIARYVESFTPQRRFTVDPNTLALYHCDEGKGNVLRDESGNDHHGIVTGAAWVPVSGLGLDYAALGDSPRTPAN